MRRTLLVITVAFDVGYLVAHAAHRYARRNLY